LHLGHANIIQLCSRPFKDVDDMNKKLISNWNARVKKDDYVFHIGDFCYKTGINFKNYVKQLNGNIIFISGNHDSNNGVRTPILDITIHHGGENLMLIHNPSDINYFGGLVLCGHVHQNWKFQRRWGFYNLQLDNKDERVDFCNVGVDQWRYMPISIDEILKEYNIWKVNQQ
jgi:calcineurin-like phosphoesterase family protein